MARSNKAAEQIFHTPNHAYIGRHCWEIVHCTSGPIPECPLIRARSSLQRESMELRIGEGWFSVSADPILDANGQYSGAVHIVSDITERKRAEEKLRNYNTRLEADVAERTRALSEAQEKLVRQEKLAVLGQLAGGVGHELRNPLAAINNAVYYLKMVQPEADEKVKQYHGLIEHEVHTAEKIITDLLDFARVKSVEREQVAVRELVKRVLERFPVPESITTVLDLPANLPRVFVDQAQMEQVLGNLTTNACQAMREGGTLSIISEQASVEQGQWVLIRVKDTGLGITPEHMQKLFEPLFTTKPRGIGLGLAVSKKLAEANGGRIEVESEPGKGSTFTVYLPVKEY